MAGDNEAGLRLVVENGQGFVGALNDAHAAQTRFVDGLGQTAAKSGGFGQIITGALRQIGSIAVDAFMEAGKAAIGFVTDSIKVAGDFEAGMGRFAAVTGDSLADSGLSLKDFRDQFLQLGKDTQYSAAEAEEAAINLAKGGIDPLTISATALKGTMDLAAAGELDLGVASEITAKQLGVWKDAGLDGVTMANLLAQAANASTVDVEDLAMGLANSGGTAKTAGVDYKEPGHHDGPHCAKLQFSHRRRHILKNLLQPHDSHDQSADGCNGGLRVSHGRWEISVLRRKGPVHWDGERGKDVAGRDQKSHERAETKLPANHLRQ